jgi:hypothetical protein
MTVSIEDAEAYELPEITTAGHKRSYEPDDQRYEENEGLLSARTTTGKSLNIEDEVQGKGTTIDSLIARVCTFTVNIRHTDDSQTVPSTDNPDLPTLTLRTLILGSFFCILGASASMIFYFKSNAPTFSSYFVILATYPLGRLMASERFIKRGKRVWGLELNPGEFGIKEAILVR